jgi:aminopeptidase YwaD
MRKPRLLSLALLLAMAAMLSAQSPADSLAIAHMRTDVRYLASDSLHGRETATPYEGMASDWIIAEMKEAGLTAKGDSAGFLQAFTFDGMPVRGAKNSTQVGRNQLKLGADFYPVSWSSSTTVFTRLAKCRYGILAPEKGRNDFEDVDVKDHAAAISIGSPDGIQPHSEWLDYHDLGRRIRDAIAQGANAVLLYNDDPTATDPDSTLNRKVRPCGVPVIFLTKQGFKKLGLDGEPIVVSVDIDRPVLTGHNVAGFIDNGQPNIVVVGAHYDHLGMGIEGTLYRGEPAVHNGADDNASGVAALLQIARDLKTMPDAKSNDYLLLAFSGEELGLFGSNWWVKHPTVPLSELNYMINMDMVGRLDTSNTLIINGVGTSPAWNMLRPDTTAAKMSSSRTSGKPAHRDTGKPKGPEPLKLKLTESGVGPSDHTSFYLKDIPVLHYFTGAHEDYHKPSDDEEKINYNGMVRVVRHIESLIVSLDDDGKLPFTKTAADTSEVPSFKVTLGVVPDYAYSGEGMRIDGVTDGKPASKAGLKAGDVVVKLGENRITDMMSYMKGLGKFTKGEQTVVTVLRDGKEMKVNVTW